MTLDYNSKDEIVKGKDLKSGDVVRSKSWSNGKDGNDMGIIIATTFSDSKEAKELKRFYCNKPAYSIYDINSPCDGPLSSHLDPEQEFKVVRSRKDILNTYDKIELQLLSRSADLMNQRNDLTGVQTIAVNNMNNRLDELKSKSKEDNKNGL